MRVLTSFDLRSKLGLTKGVLVILAKKSTSGVPVPEWVAPRCSRCSLVPMERMIFLNFLGSNMQIEGEQNTISIAALSLSNISSTMRGVR